MYEFIIIVNGVARGRGGGWGLELPNSPPFVAHVTSYFIRALKIGFISFNLSSLDKGC